MDYTYKNNNRQKKIISDIIYGNKICGSCCEGNELKSLYSVYIINNEEWLLKDLIQRLYGVHVENVLVSSWICDPCIDTVMKSYFFIHNIQKNNDFLKRVSNMIFNGRYIYKDEDKVIMNLDLTNKLGDSEKSINVLSHANNNAEESTKPLTPYQCCTCHMKFSKFSLWYQHFSQHNALLFKCEHCNSEFSSIHLLMKHRKDAHFDKLSYCHICNLILKKKRKRKHFKRYHKSDIFICDVCNKCCYSKVFLERHISLKHVECVDSSNSYVINKKHQCPLQYCQCIPYLCAFCNQDFVSKDLLEHHMKHKHLLDAHMSKCHTNVIKPNKNGTTVLNYSNKNECKKCNIIFKTKINYNKHISAHKINKGKVNIANNKKNHMKSNTKNCKNMQKLMCDQCGLVFNEKSLLIHIKTHKDQKQCQFCQKFLSSALLKEHLKNHFNSEKYRRRTLKCTKCDYSTPFLDCFEAHNNRVHLETRPFQCNTCKKAFYSRVTLNEHSKIHSGLKPEQCHECGNRFVSKKALRLHVRIHTGEKPYACDLCDEKFLSASRRQAHRIRKHFEPTVPCEICLKKYYTKSYLRVHIRECHSSEPRPRYKNKPEKT